MLRSNKSKSWYVLPPLVSAAETSPQLPISSSYVLRRVLLRLLSVHWVMGEEVCSRIFRYYVADNGVEHGQHVCRNQLGATVFRCGIDGRCVRRWSYQRRAPESGSNLCIVLCGPYAHRELLWMALPMHALLLLHQLPGLGCYIWRNFGRSDDGGFNANY